MFADGLVGKVLVPAVVAPLLAFLVAGLGDRDRLPGGRRASAPAPVTRGFRFGQIVSGGLLALAHGTNDAQKTMGVITLALIANGTLGAERRPADLGDRLRGDRDRRSAPTAAAGGSSARPGPGSSRWTPPRDSRPRAPARR